METPKFCTPPPPLRNIKEEERIFIIRFLGYNVYLSGEIRNLEILKRVLETTSRECVNLIDVKGKIIATINVKSICSIDKGGLYSRWRDTKTMVALKYHDWYYSKERHPLTPTIKEEMTLQIWGFGIDVLVTGKYEKLQDLKKHIEFTNESLVVLADGQIIKEVIQKNLITDLLIY